MATSGSTEPRAWPLALVIYVLSMATVIASTSYVGDHFGGGWAALTFLIGLLTHCFVGMAVTRYGETHGRYGGKR